jgi:hypothetical protein
MFLKCVIGISSFCSQSSKKKKEKAVCVAVKKMLSAAKSRFITVYDEGELV